MAAANAEGMSKLDAVRQALKDLGTDAMPIAIQTHVLKAYGVDMSTAHVSNYKTMILRGDKPGKKRRKRRKNIKAEAVVAVVAAKAVAPVSVSSSATVTVAEIEAVKGLVSRVGESTLKELIDVISK